MQAKRSITPRRESVYWALKRLGPCAVREIYMELAADVPRVTVYRALELFIALGIAEYPRPGRIDLRPPFRNHRHTMVCEQCGRQIDFNNEALERALERVVRSRGFGMRHHRMEVLGRCGVCLGTR
jgi:Fe2+ or Zn2+ uptake regulation protein